jgi:hypothetical protein
MPWFNATPVGESVAGIIEEGVDNMKSLLAILVVAAVATTAMAGDNPQVYAYISFDPAGDEAMSAVAPAAYTTVNAYVCLGCIQGGVTVVSFGLNNALAEYPGVFATQQFTNLMPGGLAIGDPFAGGVTIASTECLTMDPVIVGFGSYFYLGGNGCIKIVDHATYPRWVVDCEEPGVQDYYCLKGHGTVALGVCTDGLENCQCGSAVEDATWGGIKALYK